MLEMLQIPKHLTLAEFCSCQSTVYSCVQLTLNPGDPGLPLAPRPPTGPCVHGLIFILVMSGMHIKA